MARRADGRVRLLTRKGNDFSRRFPPIVAAVTVLLVRSCLIDGEAVVCNESGLAVFDLIRGYRHDAAAVLCAFDLVELDGEDLRRTPIEERKRMGIVSKRLGSPYRSGRTDHWVKVKNLEAPAVAREADEDWGRLNSSLPELLRRRDDKRVDRAAAAVAAGLTD